MDKYENAVNKQIADWEKQYKEEQKEIHEKRMEFLSYLPKEEKEKALSKFKPSNQ